jgi:mxaK protein
VDRALRLKTWLAVTSAALLAGVAYEGMRLAAAMEFNAAVQRGDLEAASRLDHPYGRFAAALAGQRRGELERAPQAYGSLGREEPALRGAVRFNLANSYMRRAFALEGAGGDLVEPLVELAKQEYREVLRAESDAWDARYNLELALSVQPDVIDSESAAEAMPEHSRQAIATQRKLERLP